MRMISRFAGFFHSDPDYAPFGIYWLRGLTPARVGLVMLICGIFTMRQSWRAPIVEILQFLAVQLVCFLPALLLVTVADNASAKSSNARRVAWLAGAAVGGAIAYPIAYLMVFPELHVDFYGWDSGKQTLAVLMLFFRPLLYGGLLTAVLYFITRERRTTAALHQTQINRLALDRQMTEAHLQALQAQIEPHFLFNTLANIRRLYQIDPTQGKRMIHDLSGYLHAALPQMREAGSTLRRELAMTQAYLNVLQVRMGARLKVEINVPVELLDASLPPMMLPTLVENAIKHGLNPLPEGGTVSISAARDRDKLQINIADTGAGFQKASGSGVGLANTRARLATLYGAEARLTLHANSGGGVIAAIELPLCILAVNGAQP